VFLFPRLAGLQVLTYLAPVKLLRLYQNVSAFFLIFLLYALGWRHVRVGADHYALFSGPMLDGPPNVTAMHRTRVMSSSTIRHLHSLLGIAPVFPRSFGGRLRRRRKTTLNRAHPALRSRRKKPLRKEPPGSARDQKNPWPHKQPPRSA
jgi:hypothetical protein